MTVVEYKNIHINHYFLTANETEQSAIDAGAAGAGWIRTGFGFTAERYTYPAGFGGVPVASVPVDRFHGTPGLGPNSHFFTADWQESAGLKRPGTGWDYEGVAFSIVLPTNGQCGGLTPVYRFYNRRAVFNDTNHRYVTDAGERAAMVAAGWLEEGVKFCALGTVEVPLKVFPIEMALEGNIRPSSECEDEAIHLGPCLAVNNLPVPAGKRANDAADYYALYDYTGLADGTTFTSRPTAPMSEILKDVFAHGGGLSIGLHVDTRNRGVPVLSSVNPLYQFRTDAGAPGGDPRFFPWGAGRPFETQLSVSHELTLARVALRSPGSHAFSHPTIEFIDQRSGLHLYFTMLSWGTQPEPLAEHLARDSSTGKVIVGTGHRASTSYGRNLGDTMFLIHPAADGLFSGLPRSGAFEFRVDRSEFQRVLNAARTVEPGLSPNPADYFVDNFHFNNEVYRDGEMGLTLRRMTLRLLRR